MAQNRHTKSETGFIWPALGAFDERLGFGEYYSSGGASDVATADAQQRFLTAIKITAPRVLDELRDEIVPRHVQLSHQLEDLHERRIRLTVADIMYEPPLRSTATARLPGRKTRARLENADWINSPDVQAKIESGEYELTTRELLERRDQASVRVRELWRAWGKKYSMDYDWVYFDGLFIAELVRDKGLTDLAPLWDDLLVCWGGRSHCWGVPLTPADTTFRFEMERGWEPTSERWKSFDERTRTAFDQYLQGYRLQIEGKVEKEGYVRTPRVSQPLHYEWLVERVVCDKSWQEIATKYQVLRDAVRDGVERAAKRAGITLP